MYYKLPTKGYINKFGYHVICLNGHDYLAHRYIYEKHIKRKLTRKECIHHKDKNKLNNCIYNLEIINRHNHPFKHRHNPKLPKFCNYCKKFLPTTYFSKDKFGRFLSKCKKCRSQYNYYLLQRDKF